MRTLLQTIAASLAVLSLSTGCSQEQEVKPVATALYEVPLLEEMNLPEEKGCWEDNTSIFCPVLIAENGELLHQGKPVGSGDLYAIEKEWWAREYDLLGIEVHADAKFGAVVNHLSTLDHDVDYDQLSEAPSLFHRVSTYEPDPYPPFALMGLDEFSRHTSAEPNPDALAALEERDFLGTSDEYALPLFVGYSKQHDTCLIKLQGRVVSSNELYDLAFWRLDAIVQNAGGIEALVQEPSLIERIEARLQAETNTPWHCVGAAIYGVGRAGWPEIRLEVMDYEKTTRSL